MNRQGIKMGEFSYKGIIRDLIQNIGVILLTGITLWLGAAGIGKLTYQPEYTSQATVAVSEKGSSSVYTSLSTATQMASVFSEVFQSDALKELISNDIGEDIQGGIVCKQISGTNLLMLQSVSEDPRQAYLFLQSALKYYKDVSDYVFSNATLEIVQEPDVQAEPSNSSWLISKKNELALLGILGMAGIVVMFYMFRFTVKTVEAASDLLDGDILGAIPFEKNRTGFKERKKKKALLITSPMVSMAYAEAERKIQTRVERHMREKGMKALLITSASENEGKSTIAANMALTLAEKQKKVILLDGDFRKPSQYKVFEEDAGNSVSDVLTGDLAVEDALIYNKQSHIYELFQFKAMDDPSPIMNGKKLKQLIQNLKEQADYIIVDCSPMAVTTDSEVWMQAVDTVLTVVRQDWSDVRSINDVLDIICQNCSDFAGIVLNSFVEDGYPGKSDYGYASYRSFM